MRVGLRYFQSIFGCRSVTCSVCASVTPQRVWNYFAQGYSTITIQLWIPIPTYDLGVICALINNVNDCNNEQNNKQVCIALNLAEISYPILRNYRYGRLHTYFKCETIAAIQRRQSDMPSSTKRPCPLQLAASPGLALNVTIPWMKSYFSSTPWFSASMLSTESLSSTI